MRRILWFRRDLRVVDNPLLSLEGEVLPIFIFDTNILKTLPKDDRRVSYIFHHIKILKSSLQQQGLDLKIFYGDPVEIFKYLENIGFDEVAASGDYDAYAKERDALVSMLLPFNYLHDTYIFTPEEICKDDGTPYLVFTSYYNKAKRIFRSEHLRKFSPLKQSLFHTDFQDITSVQNNLPKKLALSLASLGFEANMPEIPNLQKKLNMLSSKLEDYAKNRDYPVVDATSNLSLELRFGILGIRELLRFLVEQKKKGIDTEPFFRQLIFRDFYAYLLYHFENLAQENYKYKFDGIEDHERFEIFCEGKTGVPIVDAAIRQLLGTGLMHNRMRMICASFFTKDLLLPWQWGEAFFAKHLSDYDAASNILSWQWSAGTGIDPQPYFRIFNPWLQSKKFDKNADYIKRWIPELEPLSPLQIHNEMFMLSHKIKNYPHPIIIHKEARQKALSCYRHKL